MNTLISTHSGWNSLLQLSVYVKASGQASVVFWIDFLDRPLITLGISACCEDPYKMLVQLHWYTCLTLTISSWQHLKI